MSFIIDYGASVLVSTVVVMLVAGTIARSSQADQRATAATYTKQQALDMTEWMEEDLSTVGMNLASGATRLTAPTDSGTAPLRVTTDFAFSRRTFSFAGGTPVATALDVRYDLAQTGTATVDGTAVQLYQVRRSERVNGGAWRSAGASPANLSHFRLVLKTRDGTVTTSPSDADFLDVSFAMVPQIIQDDATIPTFTWSAAFRLHRN